MEKTLLQNKKFEKIDFTVSTPDSTEYEDCLFTNCNFYNGNLTDISFEKCTFEGCDFSLAKLNNTVFIDVQFLNCKLLGLHFEDCSKFILTFFFENCILKLSSFYKLHMKKTRFVNCNLQETDFSGADLSGAVFDGCDLHRAIFDLTKLEKADFYTSFQYSINPEKNKLKKARFSRREVIGLLNQYDLRIED